MIAYSPKTSKTRAYLYSHYNDIEIFVEDINSTNVYTLLINRIFSEKAKIEQVFSIGSKEEVIESCRNDQKEGGKKRLYIIDGDFDVVFGSKNLNLKHLYQLNVYCMENLLICKNAIIEILFNCLHNKSRAEIEKEIQPGTFLEEIAHQLHPLLIAFVKSVFCNLKKKTMGENVEKYLDNSECCYLSKEKIDIKINGIECEIKKMSPSLEVNKKIFSKVKGDVSNTLKIISGKTFLIPLVRLFLQKKGGYQGNTNTLKVQLARFCRLDIDKEFSKAINKAIQ